MTSDARRDYVPDGAALDTRFLPTAKRTVKEFSEDNMSDWAGALTYYGLLSLFPALIALTSIVGLVGDPRATTEAVTEVVTSLGPSSAADTFAGPIESLTANRGTAGMLFFAGIAGAVWSASGYVGAFTRAANVIYETPEGRSFWKLKPLQLVITLAMIVMLAFLALALVLTGPVAKAVAGPIGIGDTAVTVWSIAKWPVVVAVFLLMVSVLFHATPNAKLPGFKWVTPGAVFALVIWAIASVAFAFYVANFGSYDKTYGSLGGIVVLLVWMWITNAVLLLGMEVNAERERNREIEAGDEDAARELQLEPRAEPKTPQTT